MKVKTLNSERLDLRPYTSADLPALFELRSDPMVNKYVDRPKPKNMDEVRAFLEKIQKGIQAEQMISWGIYLKDSQQLMGTIGYWQYNEARTSADIGYDLLPAYWRKGYMQEAFSLTLPHFFHELKFQKMEAWVNVDNIASIRFLEKNNFQKIRLVPKGEAGDPSDMFVFGLEL